MALNVTVTANEAFADGATVDRAALRRAAKPTVSITGAVSAAEVGDETINNAKLAHMAANTVKVRDANSAGDPSDKAVADTQILIGDGTGFTAAPLSGDVTMANTGAVTIADNSVEGSMLNDNAADEATIERSGSGGTLSLKAKGIAVTHLADGTAGTMLGYGTGGVAAVISAGTSGQILTSNGSAAPSFQANTGALKLLAYSQTVVIHTANAADPTEISSIAVPENHGFSHVMVEADFKGGTDTASGSDDLLWLLKVGSAEKRTWEPVRTTTSASFYIEQADVTTLTWIGDAPSGTASLADRTVTFLKKGNDTGYDIDFYGFRIWGLTAPTETT